MSEIFDFLKKTDAERNKKSSAEESPADVPKVESAAPETKAANNRVIEEPVPAESETQGRHRFSLRLSTHQFQSVLDPLTVVGEQFRLLRTRLGLMQKQKGIKTVLVTSTVPQEGKSFTACGLAGVIAQEQGKRVVVIDADLRKRGSGRDLGLNGNSVERGMAQVLQGGTEFHEALLASKEPEFWFLPAGSLPTNPSELLSSPKLESTLQYAAETYDWVIVDSPPILALSDAAQIAPLCDAVLLVIRARSTPSKLVLETINRIGREKICGIVINRQKKIHSSRYYYQYYYQKSKS